MNNETVEAVTADIKKVARSVAFQWPGTITADDAEQEIWVRLLESPASMNKLLEMDDKQRYNALTRIGHQIAAQYRTDYDAFTGNYRYSVGEVRSLLDDGLMSRERNDLSVERVDMDEALDILQEAAPEYRDSLVKAYIFGTYDKTTSAARMALQRAVDKLTDLMNQVYRNRHADGSRGRKAMSNAAAQARTANQWSE